MTCNPNTSVHTRPGDPRGLSTVAVIAGLVVVVVIVVVVILALTPETNNELTEEQKKEEVQELGQMLSAAIQNDRDTSALIPRAAKLAGELQRYAPASMFYGQVLMHNGQLDEAAVQLRKSLDLDPNADQAHALLGALHVKLEKYDAARSNFKQAISLNKENAEHRVKLANCELEAGDLTAAQRHALDALKLDSEHHKAYMMLSLIFEQQEKLELAQQQMAKALDVLPGEEEATRRAYARRRAMLLRTDNRPAEALNALSDLPPDDIYTMELTEDLAKSYDMMGQPALAGVQFEKLLSIDPSNDQAAALSAQWYLKAGEKEAARNMVERLERINPRHSMLLDLQKQLTASE